MKRFFGSMAIATSLLYGYGCADNGLPPQDHNGGTPSAPIEKPEVAAAPRSPTTVAQPVAVNTELDHPVAMVKGEPMTMRQLMDPLIKSHGLPTLLSLVEVELARQDAVERKITVTAQDFQDEYRLTLEKVFKDSDDAKLLGALEQAEKEKRDSDAEFLRNEIKIERDDLLAQVLANKHMNRVEFDVWLQRNTYLRKIAEPQIEAEITPEALQRAFGQMYGERIKVKYIELENMEEVTVAKQRLAAGESFEAVARSMSHDGRTRDLDGELPAFTRANKNVPETFKEVAFSLKDGQISDVVVIGNWKDLIKRIHVIQPEHVKYENVKDEVYRALHDSLLEAAIQNLQRQLAAQVRVDMKIIDPVLSRQFDEQLGNSVKAAKKATEDLARRQRLEAILKRPATTRPATQPINETMPATTSVAPQAAGAQTDDRPPATQGSK